MRAMAAAGLLAFVLAGSASAQPGARPAEGLRADQTAFRAIYEELVEIDTSTTNGSCTRAAEAMAAHLRAAGYPASDVQVLAPTEHPQDGNIVAVLRGSNPRAGALLLLAHLDVVDARREDWERDPFTLVEENGYFYGRGSSDDKAMGAVWVDLMVRLRQEHFRPRRDIKMALTCGEETSTRTNGVRWLISNHRSLVAASLALNEGAGGLLEESGRHVALEIQAGEKIHQVFTLTTTNPGGHSSRPRPDNAIYQLAQGLDRLAAYQFPIELNAATRTYLTRMGAIAGGARGADMAALVRNPRDEGAAARLTTDPSLNAILRTTCVATMLTGGHAPNALPQRASATVSCRILPGHTLDETRDVLQRAMNDPGIVVSAATERQPSSPPPPLSRQVLGPVEHVSERLWPGVPLVPSMSAGATDARWLNQAGIPTYGLSGMFSVPGESNAHGLNEKIRVRSLYEGRDFLDGVVREYAQQR